MQWMVVSWTPAHPPLKKTDINLHMQIKLSQGVYTLKSGWLFGNENGWRTVHESPPAMACTPLSGPGKGLGHLMAITAPTSSTTFCHCISYPLTYTYIYICTDIHIHTYFFMCVLCVCVCFLLYLEVIIIIITTSPSVPIWIQVWSLYLI